MRFPVRGNPAARGHRRSAAGEAASAGTGLVGAPAPPVAEQGVELEALPRVEREHVIVRHARRAAVNRSCAQGQGRSSRRRRPSPEASGIPRQLTKALIDRGPVQINIPREDFYGEIDLGRSMSRFRSRRPWNGLPAAPLAGAPTAASGDWIARGNRLAAAQAEASAAAVLS